MTEPGVTRKLTAIMSADVKGYSRLMADDEAATVRRLTAHRRIISRLVDLHHGRVVDSPGDNLLAEFTSAVNAVQCVVEVQEELRVQNADLPEERRMAWRIGINLGDVIAEGERIYGDGVNVAARIEGIAEPGGVCVSRSVYDQVKGKLAFGFEYLGEHGVKNIAEPVRVYRVGIRETTDAAYPGPDKPGQATTTDLRRTERPSVAVLPFESLGRDPENDYLGDGMSESIITALSRIPDMLVIARNSTFTYKGKHVKVQEVGRDLGVRYVLEGSVQRAGDRVRVTAQLIDAATGHHLWADRYDRYIRDIFALQDEITLEIVLALQVQLTSGEQTRVQHKSTRNLEAWGLCVQAIGLAEGFTREGLATARRLVDQALELDSGYVTALTMKAMCYIEDVRQGFSQSPLKSLGEAERLVQQALAIDDADSVALTAMGYLSLVQWRHDQAVDYGERAVALDPNNAMAHAMLAHTKYYTGQYDQTILLIKKAMRLHPHYPYWHLVHLGLAYLQTEQYDLAREVFRELVARAPDRHWGYAGLALVHARLGQEEEARRQVDKAKKVNPELTLQTYAMTDFYQDPKVLKRILDDLRRAGLK
ncbi:MAG: tetratricopeptide repeat protein [Proteobacteria bacterium]|nr:tetratricopeptide repeat protein [Pseudomonadota bacterium]MBU1740955.1 tetratricopeptide repeat protein [Pseudomonadota bacterium]